MPAHTTRWLWPRFAVLWGTHCSPLLYPLGNKPALLSSSILTAVLSCHLRLTDCMFHEVSSQYLFALIRSAKKHFHKSEDFNVPTEKMWSPLITLFYAERFQTSEWRLSCIEVVGFGNKSNCLAVAAADFWEAAVGFCGNQKKQTNKQQT